MRIRRTKDLDLITELDRAAFPADKPLNEEHHSEAAWWVLSHGTDDSGDVGYIGLWSANDQEVVLVRYGVDARQRCKGLGRRLVKHSIRAARRLGYTRMTTYVVLHNLESFRCLLACGFVPYRIPGDWSIHLELQL